ncbi:MAG: succinate dehydrogenase assembly factor 2 [Gammaproteobacteria bacterium]|nr:succinate dehydrogenase assembly factor 2 [Gammaproteobacteria bacterium]
MRREERSRLLWRCRRGARELDALLTPFTEQHYESMPTSQRAALGRLLKRQDPEILDWLFNRTRPDEPELGALIDAILEFKVKKKSQSPETE